MSYTYDTYTSALTVLMVTSTADSNFVAIEPSIIDYAEQRIYRELDLLDTTVTVAGTLNSSTKTFALPTTAGSPIVTQYVKVFTPVGTTSSNSSATTIVLTPTSREFIDVAYPSVTAYSTVPRYFATLSSSLISLGPAPNLNYGMEWVGTIRPTALSSTNQTTLLTTYVPDLFMAASMVFASGYMRNFGSQADNSQMAQSWESQYQILKGSASIETLRQKFDSWGWTSENPSPVAKAKRD